METMIPYETAAILQVTKGNDDSWAVFDPLGGV
jgi:hypothetical protein